MVRVAGIDQSTKKTGFSVMEHGELLHYELIDLSKHSEDYLERIIKLREIIEQKIDEFEVEAVCLEDTTLTQFAGRASSQNVEVLKKLTKCLGTIEIMLIEKNIAFETVKATQWRAGKGFRRRREEQKEDVVNYVNKTYSLDLTMKDNDIAESIALAEFLSKQFNKMIDKK